MGTADMQTGTHTHMLNVSIYSQPLVPEEPCHIQLVTTNNVINCMSQNSLSLRQSNGEKKQSQDTVAAVMSMGSCHHHSHAARL